MYVDYLTLACLRDHLDGLLGARVQRAVLVDPLSVGLELYAGERHQLLASAHPQHARMLVVPYKLRRGAGKETAFTQILRKWIRGARLVDVTQPPWERILHLHFEGQAGDCRLVAELIGRYSNLILVGPEGRILDAVKHVGPKMNRYRTLLPGRPYQPPPIPLGRRPPDELSASEWASHVSGAGVCRPNDPLHRLLPRRLLGVSPLLAREIVFRATGDLDTPVRDLPPQELKATIDQILAPTRGQVPWAPGVALDTEGQVTAFAAYPLHHREHTEPTSSISQAIGRYYEARLTTDPYGAARGRVQEQIDEARDRLEHTQAQLRTQVRTEEEIDALRRAGELLLAYPNRVSPGASRVTVPDFDGNPRTIEIDPRMSPVENAQAYFRRYRKASRATREVATRLRQIGPDLVHLNQLAADLDLAESRPEIDAVYEALVEGGWAQKRRRPSSAKQAAGPRRYTMGGFTVLVGRNARQNEELTFKRAGADDLWLHVRGMPGAHVIIRCGQESPPEAVVRRAAQLAVRYSPARHSGKTAVDVTRRRFVRRAPGGHPGLVTYRNERTVWVEPQA